MIKEWAPKRNANLNLDLTKQAHETMQNLKEKSPRPYV